MAECCCAANRFQSEFALAALAKLNMCTGQNYYTGFLHVVDTLGTFALVCEIDESALTELLLTFSPRKRYAENPNFIILICSASRVYFALMRTKRLSSRVRETKGTPNSLYHRIENDECTYFVSEILQV